MSVYKRHHLPHSGVFVLFKSSKYFKYSSGSKSTQALLWAKIYHL